MKQLAKVFLLLLILCPPAFGKGSKVSNPSIESTTVILLRHAERADNSADSELSPAGRDRADLLARMLVDSHPDALYATEYKRTQQTLRPLANEVGLPINILPAESLDELVERIRTQTAGGVVVVASHSDRIPQLVERLTGTQVSPLGHNEYSRLYILQMTAPGRGRVLELHFGNPDPESSPQM